MSEYVFRTNKTIKCCGDCPAIKSPAGFNGSTYYDSCHLDESLEVMAEERHEKCPLKELPPHGDLIDRSELIIVGITDYAFEGHTVVEYEDVQNAPTILEASKEEKTE